MKKLAFFAVSTLVVAGCGGGYEWRNTMNEPHQRFNAAALECYQQAREAIPNHLGPFPIRTSPTEVITIGPTTERFVQRQQVFQGCMAKKGWYKEAEEEKS